MYDLNGNVEYEGEWVNNLPFEKESKNRINVLGDDLILPISIEELIIDENLGNEVTITTIHFSPLLILLRRIVIKKNCFQNVSEFIVDGLAELESLIVSEECFGPRYDCYDHNYCDYYYVAFDSGYDYSDFDKYSGYFDYSDSDTYSGYFDYEDSSLGALQITNCPNIQKLEIENWCFLDFNRFVLSDVNSLHTLKFGNGCFPYAKCILEGG